MIYILTGVLIALAVAFLYPNQEKNNTTQKSESKTSSDEDAIVEKDFFADDDLSFSEKLHKTKELYPFSAWRKAFFEYDMEQYTAENCNAAKAIFDNLIEGLLKLGEDAKENEKIALFEKAVYSLNDLDTKVEGLIETGEREDLCELIDQITLAAGLNPTDYAGGEGLADLWRGW